MTRPPRSAAWLLLFALLVVAVSLGTNQPDVGPTLLALVVAAVVTLGVMVTHPGRAPLGMLALGLLTGWYAGLGYDDGPMLLVVPVGALVLGWLAEEAPRRLAAWSTLAVVLGGIGLLTEREVVGGDGDHSGALPSLLMLTALTAAGAAIGHTLATRRRERAATVRRTVSEEQLRMARDLHDGVGHGLAVIAMQAGAALHVLDRDPASVRANLEAIRDQSRESLDMLRTELAQLSGDGAPRRPAPGLADLGTLVARVRGGGLDVVVTGTPGAVPTPADQAAYAVVQESLTNVLRHADASRATVRLERADGRLSVTVSDDGRPAAAAREGSGILGMRARVADLGGRLVAGPSATGFVVRAELPL